MSLTLCVLLWARPGAEDTLSAYEDRALDEYMSNPRRLSLADERDRAIARTQVIDVELIQPR